MTITRLVFFHLFQFYYIFTKFNWYVCCVGLSLGSPLFVLQFLHPSFKVPDKEMAYKAKFIHPNHKNFVQVISPENRYRLVGCTIPRVYVVREELPLHQLEWRGCKVDDDGNKEEESPESYLLRVRMCLSC